MAATPEMFSAAEAAEIVGSLGFPSKMPGTSYGIPTRHCNVGGKLKLIAGSTCSLCYADETKDRGRYGTPAVKIAQDRRFSSLSDPRWASAMATALLIAHGMLANVTRRGRRLAKKVHRKIKPGGQGWHRWHDAGDLQSLAHLCAIVVVCQMTPQIRHWLPTREAGIVAQFLKNGGVFPPNLCVRVSATMIDGPPSRAFWNTSTVHTKGATVRGEPCEAKKRGGLCGPCRLCWELAVENTSYPIH